MSFRGKLRKVVEVLGVERVNPENGPGFYRVTAKLECGHVVKTSAHNRYAKGETPVVGYCRDPLCIAGKAVAA